MNVKALPQKWARARKGGRCAACGSPILPGQWYWQVAPPFVPATRFCSPECDR